MIVVPAYLQEQIRELEPVRAQLVLVSEQCEKKVLHLREQERSEIRALKQERQHLQQVIEDMKEQQRALQTQVGSAQNVMLSFSAQGSVYCHLTNLLFAIKLY